MFAIHPELVAAEQYPVVAISRGVDCELIGCQGQQAAGRVWAGVCPPDADTGIRQGEQAGPGEEQLPVPIAAKGWVETTESRHGVNDRCPGLTKSLEQAFMIIQGNS